MNQLLLELNHGPLKFVLFFESGSHGILKKKQRLNKHEQIENALYHWITTLAAGTPGLSTEILLQKAIDFGNELGYSDDEISKLDKNWIKTDLNRKKAYFHGGCTVKQHLLILWQRITGKIPC